MVKGLPTKWGACFRTILTDYTLALTCWKDLIATGGIQSGDIQMLNATTGVCTSVLSEHTQGVNSLTFSFDGSLLVSGSRDKTIKLWDVQTGGVIKTFHGHTRSVSSVSISLDCTMIASGSLDETICLWDAQTGECAHIIGGHKRQVNSVSFHPTNSQLLISASHDNTVQWWDINGHPIGSTYSGCGVTFSSDGTHFVSWGQPISIVRNTDSEAVVAKLHVPDGNLWNCCFSPNGKFVAGAAGSTIYIWDITDSDSHLIETFVGPDGIDSLTFSSSLVLVFYNGSLNFWQIGDSPTDPVASDSESTPPGLPSINQVTLQANDSIIISTDLDGVVRTWNVSTGQCNASFHTPAQYFTPDDVWYIDGRLIEGRLILAWSSDEKIHIWDTEKGELLQIVGVPDDDWYPKGLRISGDGSKKFLLDDRNHIKAWSIWTGEAMGAVKLEGDAAHITVDGSRVCAYLSLSQAQWWDFGVTDLTSIPLSNTSQGRFSLDIGWWLNRPSGINDTVTRRKIFQLSGRYAGPSDIQWDGQYLVAGYDFGELLILDFNHVLPQ